MKVNNIYSKIRSYPGDTCITPIENHSWDDSMARCIGCDRTGKSATEKKCPLYESKKQYLARNPEEKVKELRKALIQERFRMRLRELKGTGLSRKQVEARLIKEGYDLRKNNFDRVYSSDGHLLEKLIISGRLYG